MFDDLPKPKKYTQFPCDLTDMSVAEIEDYIGELKSEVIRAEQDIEKKKGSAAAAESLFK